MKQSVILVVPQDVLADVINAIQPFGVTIKRIEAIVDDEPKRTVQRQAVPIQQQRLGGLVIKALQTGPCTMEDIRIYIAQHGFAAASASPTVTRLVRQKQAIREVPEGGGPAVYRIAPTTANGQLAV